MTGGLGFLGVPLVKALLKEGYQLRVLDNFSRGSAEYLGEAKSDVEIIAGDIRDADVVYRAIRGVDSVCHLAFVNGTRYFYERPAYVLDVGVKAMVNVLDACIRVGVGELFLASSSEVYQTPPKVPTDESVPLSVPDPYNPRYSYGGGKIISELMAIHYGREYFDRVVIFRPHNVIGPNMGWEHVVPQFVTRLLNLEATTSEQEIPFPIQGTGDQSRAFIYIEDFIHGLMLVIHHGEHLNIYNIGTTEEIKIRDVAHRVAHCLGKCIRVLPGSEAIGGTLRRCPDIRKLKQLGFRPRFNFDEALPQTVQWYVEHLRPVVDIDAMAEAKVFLKEQ
ncbi:NAD-dependent epimerase/dehydratase family protein [Desulfobacterota bacterium AH_259_B03_O07]|nr:NAD-dependent epimerase/dehydratase family protein [Desulfobacterota bacterium AH_259_B03_O07]